MVGKKGMGGGGNREGVREGWEIGLGMAGGWGWVGGESYQWG